MPQVDWPVRSVPCGTLALADDQDHFYVRPSDRNSLPNGKEVRYIRTVNNVEMTSTAYVGVHPTRADTYQLFDNDDLTGTPISVPSSFHLEIDVGIIVNYPTRPMLTSPGLQSNTTITNPLAVSRRDIGQPRYEGSFELDVVRSEDAGIVEAFVDQLYDPSNWFELQFPGSHLGTASVTAYDSSTRDITINKATDESYHGWWVRVGRRTGRITHDVVALTWVTNHEHPNDGYHRYAHVIRIVPHTLITGTTAENAANNFAGQNQTCRVRAESVTAVGRQDFDASWTIDFVETDGD